MHRRFFLHTAIAAVILLVAGLAIAQDKAPSDIPSQNKPITRGISTSPAALGACCVVQDVKSPPTGAAVFELLKGSFGALVGAFLAFVSVFYLTLRVEKRKRRSVATVLVILMNRNKQLLDDVRPKIDTASPLPLVDETLTYNLFVANADLFKSQTVHHVLSYTKSIKLLTQYIEDFKDSKDRDDKDVVAAVKNYMAYASDMASRAINSLRDEGKTKKATQLDISSNLGGNGDDD